MKKLFISYNFIRIKMEEMKKGGPEKIVFSSGWLKSSQKLKCAVSKQLPEYIVHINRTSCGWYIHTDNLIFELSQNKPIKLSRKPNRIRQIHLENLAFRWYVRVLFLSLPLSMCVRTAFKSLWVSVHTNRTHRSVNTTV